MNLSVQQKRLAKNVKERREEKGWTQEKMREFGFNYRYYQKIESATGVNVTLDTLVKLANVFKCKPYELLK